MYTNNYDIEFCEKDGFERRKDYDFLGYNDNICEVFFYKNLMVEVTCPTGNSSIIEIEIPCTINEQYFSSAMKELADSFKFERIDVKDFNMNDLMRSLNILNNIAETF